MSKVFLHWFFGVAGAIVLAIFAFNVAIEAYILHTPAAASDQLIAGFERVMKPGWFAALKPDTVFVGSSRVRMAYDPVQVDPAFHVNSFNYGVSAETAYEARRVIQDVVAKPDVKTIVVAVDAFAAGQAAQPVGAGFDETRFALTPSGQPTPRRPLWLFTSQYLGGGALGMHATVAWQIMRLKAGQTAADRPDLFPAYAMMTPAIYRDEMKRRVDHTMDLDPWRTAQMLKSLDLLCASRATTVWYFPSDDFPTIVDYVANDAAGFIAFKQTVLATVERHNAACVNQIRLFDFMNLNPITADDAAAHGGKSVYYDNPVHVRPPTGLILLRQMLGPPGTPGPGVELTGNPNADAEIRSITGQVAEWRRTHPGE